MQSFYPNSKEMNGARLISSICSTLTKCGDGSGYAKLS